MSAATDDATQGIPVLDRTNLQGKLALEDGHWWYRGRRMVIRAALERIGARAMGEVLDAGCGTGHNLGLLAPFGPVAGVDLNPEVVQVARARGVDAHCAPVDRLPFVDSRFELVACLDVLEHVADDAAALLELKRVTRSGGTIVVTVPAYPWLVSNHDRAAGHRRRYSRRSLLQRADDLGLRPVLVTYFNSILLPIVIPARLARRSSAAAPKSDLLRTPAALDAIMGWPMRAETRLIRGGLDLPAGLSILCVLVRP